MNKKVAHNLAYPMMVLCDLNIFHIFPLQKSFLRYYTLVLCNLFNSHEDRYNLDIINMIHLLKVFLYSNIQVKGKFYYHEMQFNKDHILYTSHQQLFDVYLYIPLFHNFYHLLIQFHNQNNFHIHHFLVTFTGFNKYQVHMFSNLGILNTEDNLDNYHHGLTSTYYYMLHQYILTHLMKSKYNHHTDYICRFQV